MGNNHELCGAKRGRERSSRLLSDDSSGAPVPTPKSESSTPKSSTASTQQAAIRWTMLLSGAPLVLGRPERLYS